MNATNQFTNFTALREAVQCARDTAATEAKRCCPWVWSRGTWLVTLNAKRDRISPCSESGGHYWGGTKQELTRLVSEVLLHHPEVDEIYLEGGYDGGQQMSDKNDGLYEPWIAEWEVCIWRRPKAMAAPEGATPCLAEPSLAEPSQTIPDHASPSLAEPRPAGTRLALARLASPDTAMSHGCNDIQPVRCKTCAEQDITALATVVSAKGHPVCQPCANEEREILAIWQRAREATGI